jgi:hypothetical protein
MIIPKIYKFIVNQLLYIDQLMKNNTSKISLLIFSFLLIAEANAQITIREFNGDTRSLTFWDSLKQALIHAREDSGKVQLLGQIAITYVFLNADSSSA